MLTVARADVPTKVRGVQGEAGLIDNIYQPIFDLLQDHKPHTILELETHLASKGVAFAQLHSALNILFGLGVVQPAAPAQDYSKAKARCLALNKAIARRSLSVGDIVSFASPVTGGGVAAQRFSQLFWLSKQSGGRTAADWASFAWSVLSGQGQNILKDGAQLQGEDNLKELTSQAEAWGEKVLPVWTALGI